jgi:hypothetical protein
MAEVVRFGLADGSSVLVEVDEESLGIRRVGRTSDGVIEAGRQLTDALGTVSDAARASFEVLRQLNPDRLELDFGVKLSGEAGALIAKTAAEGHFTVKVTWSPNSTGVPRTA